MNNFWFFVVVAIVFYVFGYAQSLSSWYEGAKSGKLFEYEGKVYRIVEVKIDENNHDTN